MSYKTIVEFKPKEAISSGFSTMSMQALFEMIVKLGRRLDTKSADRPTDKQRAWMREALFDAQNVIQGRLNELYLHQAPRDAPGRLNAFLGLSSEARARHREAWMACEGLDLFTPNPYYPIGIHAGNYFPDRDRIAIWNPDAALVPIPYLIEELRVVVPDEATRIYT